MAKLKKSPIPKAKKVYKERSGLSRAMKKHGVGGEEKNPKKFLRGVARWVGTKP